MDCQPGVIRTPGLFSTASFGGGRTIEKSCRKTLVSTCIYASENRAGLLQEVAAAIFDILRISAV